MTRGLGGSLLPYRVRDFHSLFLASFPGAQPDLIFYYFHDETLPLFLLTIFGKNEKENLSRAERNALAKLTKSIVQSYKRKNE